jgi:hypothetical protein
MATSQPPQKRLRREDEAATTVSAPGADVPDFDSFAEIVLSRSVLGSWASSPLLAKVVKGGYALVRPSQTQGPRLMALVGVDPTPASAPYVVEVKQPSGAAPVLVSTDRKVLVRDGARPPAPTRITNVSDQPVTKAQFDALVATGAAPSRSAVAAVQDERVRLDRDRRRGVYCTVGPGAGVGGALWGTPGANHRVHLFMRSWLLERTPSKHEAPGPGVSAGVAAGTAVAVAPDGGASAGAGVGEGVGPEAGPAAGVAVPAVERYVREPAVGGYTDGGAAAFLDKYRGEFHYLFLVSGC